MEKRRKKGERVFTMEYDEKAIEILLFTKAGKVFECFILKLGKVYDNTFNISLGTFVRLA